MRSTFRIPFSSWKKVKGGLLVFFFSALIAYLTLLDDEQFPLIIGTFAMGAFSHTVFWRLRKVFIVNLVEGNTLCSKLYLRKLYCIDCRKSVYYDFFQDDFNGIMERSTYIILSNEKFPIRMQGSRLHSFDMKKQIVMPYNKRTRLVLSSWLDCENWIFLGSRYPSADELAK